MCGWSVYAGKKERRLKSFYTPIDKSSLEPRAPVYTVSEVTRFIKNTLEAEAFFQNIWLKGETSNLRQPQSLHIYFTLKDEFTQIECVCFRDTAQSVPFKIENGMSVLVRGNVTVYEKAGKYQVIVREVQAEGIGSLYLAFEQLKEKLKAEGLFSEERKKPLPQFPKKIAVITSPTGAAIRDVLTTLHKRWPLAPVVLVPAVVQGDGAAPALVKALSDASRMKNVDIILLVRGGGSLEELWPFNEESVARAIVSSRIPVVTGIGHETDFTIADFVADLRAPTPTGAAQAVVLDKNEIRRMLLNYASNLSSALASSLDQSKWKLRHLQSLRCFQKPKERMLELQQTMDDSEQRLGLFIRFAFERKMQALKETAQKLEALSPLNVLSRGYSVALRLPEKKVVYSVEKVKPEDRLQVLVSDGKINCDVVNVEK